MFPSEKGYDTQFFYYPHHFFEHYNNILKINDDEGDGWTDHDAKNKTNSTSSSSFFFIAL
jgi:hypothetical protein